MLLFKELIKTSEEIHFLEDVFDFVKIINYLY